MGVTNDTLALIAAMPRDGRPHRMRLDRYTLALWLFREGSGTTVADETGNYPLTLGGDAAWATFDPSNFGWNYPYQNWTDSFGVTLSGSGYLTAAAGLLDTVPNQWSIEVWLMPSVTYPNADSDPRIICKSPDGTNYIDVFWRNGSGGPYTQNTISGRVGHGGTDKTWTPLPIYPTVNGSTASWPSGTPLHLAITFGSGTIKQYINGQLVATVASVTNPASGTAFPFVLGSLITSGPTYSNGFKGTIGPVRVSSICRSPEEINASFQQLDLPPVKSIPSKLTKQGNILTATVAWEQVSGNAVFESRVFTDETGEVVIENDGSIGMTYTGGWTSSAIGIATSTNGSTWTKYASNPVIGQGNGGQSGWAGRSRAIKYNGTYYVLAADGNGGSANNCVLYSASARTGPYTKVGTILSAVANTWRSAFGNFNVRLVGGLWKLWAEGKGADGVWRVGLFTCPANAAGTFPSNGWVESPGNPIGSLQICGGTYSVPTPIKRNGLWHALYHASSQPGVVLPTNIFYATSPNLENWTPDPYGAVITITPGGSTTEREQTADPTWFEFNSNVYIPYDVDNNVTGSASIAMATFPGTFHQLFTMPGRQPTAADQAGTKLNTINVANNNQVNLGSSQSFNNTGQTTPFPATYYPAATGSAPTSSAPAINGQTLSWAINYPVAQPFSLSNVDSTGWTQFVFTIKAKNTDADAAALVTVKLTNPGSGSDGLTLLNGAAPSSPTTAADGSISVSGVTGSTNLTLNLTSYGHALAAGNYVWELTRYSGGASTKTRLGTGPWQATQTVRANPVAS